MTLPYPFIVAEMGANHGQDPQRAIAIIDAAKAAGVDAVKLQTFQADTMVARYSSFVPNRMKAGPWSGQIMWDLYERCSMPWSWQKQLFDHGRELGLPIFSTPFDRSAVDFLEGLNCPMYKIASFEILDLGLIRYAASTKKPIIISTGMATLEEITEAVDTAEAHLVPQAITLLKCTSAYPAEAADANLATMDNLREHFDCKVGLSDHTLGMGVAIAAALRGADMIEKHMTLNAWDSGPDAGFSLDRHKMRSFVDNIHQAIDSIGIEAFGPTEAEEPMLMLRRTLHVTRNLKPGDVLTAENVKALRPGDGLAPKELHKLLGMQVTREVFAGEPLIWDVVRNRST